MEEEKKKIFIVVSGKGHISGGVFEIGVMFSKSSRSEEIWIEPKPKAVEDVIKPMETFFEQIPSFHYCEPMFGSCVIGSDLYMIPDEKENNKDLEDGDVGSRVLPCVFNLINKTKRDNLTFPKGMKTWPLVLAIDKKIYACSFADCDVPPEPAFETYVPNHGSKIWNSLGYNSVFHNKTTYSRGHAVIKKKFILVCFTYMLRSEPYDDYLWYSYNIKTGFWKPVRIPPDEAFRNHGGYLPVMRDEAVVIGKDIYMYRRSSIDRLMVFSYTDISRDDPDHDLELGSAIYVKGFKDIELFSRPRHERLITGVVVKVDGRILCLINTVRIEKNCVLHICVTFVKLEGRDFCTHLKDFRCRLETGDQLPHPRIASSFVLHQKKKSDCWGK